MTHVRKTIRDDVITELTGLTTTGTNVFDTRIFPLAQTDLPCLVVYTQNETSEYGNLTSLEREVQLVVRGIARATANVEDTLDLIAEEVETAITGGSSAKDLYLSSTATEFENDGDNQFGSIEMIFLVLYHTAANTPGVSA